MCVGRSVRWKPRCRRRIWSSGRVWGLGCRSRYIVRWRPQCSAVDLWAPRLICCSFKRAKKRSTWLIHDADVGVKCLCQRGRLANQSWISLVLWLDALSMTTWMSRSAGRLLATSSRKLRNSRARLPLHVAPHDRAGGGVEGVEQVGRCRGAYNRGCAAPPGPAAWAASAGCGPAPGSGSFRRCRARARGPAGRDRGL